MICGLKILQEMWGKLRALTWADLLRPLRGMTNIRIRVSRTLQSTRCQALRAAGQLMFDGSLNRDKLADVFHGHQANQDAAT